MAGQHLAKRADQAARRGDTDPLVGTEQDQRGARRMEKRARLVEDEVEDFPRLA